MALTATTFKTFAPKANLAVREYCGQDIDLRAFNPKFNAIKPDPLS
jgi:hypothetical protein